MAEKIIRYAINGFVYRFTHIMNDAGVKRGYCLNNDRWAWLYPDRVFFKDDFGPIFAKKLD